MAIPPAPSVDSVWLERVLAELFPAPCATAWRVPVWPTEDLPAAESASLRNAVPNRKAEFAAGRHSARTALAAVGFAHAVIPAGVDRAPIWPAGAVGSIAHAEGMAVAVAGRAAEVLGLGVDIERSGRVRQELWPQILTAAETAETERLPAEFRVDRATAIFAIKEAFYKFQYPQTKLWLNFSDVEVTLDPATGRFAASTAPRLRIGGQELCHFTGRYAIGPTFTLAGLSPLVS